MGFSPVKQGPPFVAAAKKGGPAFSGHPGSARANAHALPPPRPKASFIPAQGKAASAAAALGLVRKRSTQPEGLPHPPPQTHRYAAGLQPAIPFTPATQGVALILIHIGEHTRPRVLPLAPSPKTFGCGRERRTQQVSGEGAGNSTRGRVRSPPLARHLRMPPFTVRVVYKDQGLALG